MQQKYRWILVDEFQDTDPIQAEVLVLLTADEQSISRPTEADWSTVRLRPGALFVVGDPKQSIYRFRRADIDIYNKVRSLVLASGGRSACTHGVLAVVAGGLCAGQYGLPRPVSGRANRRSAEVRATRPGACIDVAEKRGCRSRLVSPR